MKFQRHHLIDLPVELLELIVKNASLEDARIISSTCKRLRTISSGKSLSYVQLPARSQVLLIIPVVPTTDSQYNRSQGPATCSCRAEKRSDIRALSKEHVRGLSQVSFLLGRHDITQKIKTAQLRVRSVFGAVLIACGLNRYGRTRLTLLGSHGSDTLNGITNTFVTRL